MDPIPIPSLGCALLNQLEHRFFQGDGGESVLEVELSAAVRGPGGTIHGGIIGALADIAGSYAVFRDVSRPTASTALSVQFLAPGRVGPVRASAKVLRISKSVGVSEVRISDEGSGGRLMAVAHVTLTFLQGDTWKGPNDD